MVVTDQEAIEFAESMSEVVACWMTTYVVQERLTEFRQWLAGRPHLWPMFTSIPDEEAIEGTVEVFIDVALERAMNRAMERTRK